MNGQRLIRDDLWLIHKFVEENRQAWVDGRHDGTVRVVKNPLYNPDGTPPAKYSYRRMAFFYALSIISRFAEAARVHDTLLPDDFDPHTLSLPALSEAAHAINMLGALGIKQLDLQHYTEPDDLKPGGMHIVIDWHNEHASFGFETDAYGRTSFGIHDRTRDAYGGFDSPPGVDAHEQLHGIRFLSELDTLSAEEIQSTQGAS